MKILYGNTDDNFDGSIGNSMSTVEGMDLSLICTYAGALGPLSLLRGETEISDIFSHGLGREQGVSASAMRNFVCE